MRSLVRLLLAVVVVGIVLQCQDRQGPTELSTSGELQPATAQTDILDLLDIVFDGSNQSSAFLQANNIFRQYARAGCDPTPPFPPPCDNETLAADARVKAFALVDYIWKKAIQGKTNAGSDDEAIQAMELLLLFVGFADEFGNPIDLSEALNEDAVIVKCGPAGCVAVVGTLHAGVRIPPGALDEEILVIVRRLPDDDPGEISGLAPAVSTFYPLDSGFNQYPLFYDISTVPDGVVLNAGFFADIGLCVLEQSDGWAGGAPDDVLDDLVLAHPAPGGDGTGNCDDNIECLDIVSVAGLIDCGDLEEGPPSEDLGFRGLLDDFTAAMVSPFSPSLLYASPGELGGQASSFSPFAAVDPTSGSCEIC